MERAEPRAPAPGQDLEGQSKFLAYILRHRPQSVGLALGKGGWVPVAALLDGIARHGEPMALDTLLEIVRTDAKGRYSLSPDGTMVRANQGHSRKLRVDPGFRRAVPPVRLWHGTKDRFLADIRRKGLLPMSRSHVHLSPDPETAQAVGDRRSGRTVVLGVDAKALLRDGQVFLISDNGVWLVDRVPPTYLDIPG